MNENHRNHAAGSYQLDQSHFGPDGASGYCIGRFYQRPGGTVSFIAEGFMIWGDAQNALQRSVSPETALHKGLVRAENYEDEYRPDEVELAFEFIQHCNKVQQPVVVHDRAYDGSSQVDVFDGSELHPKQEAAMVIACNVLGKYLAASLEEEDGEAEEAS